MSLLPLLLLHLLILLLFTLLPTPTSFLCLLLLPAFWFSSSPPFPTAPPLVTFCASSVCLRRGITKLRRLLLLFSKCARSCSNIIASSHAHTHSPTGGNTARTCGQKGALVIDSVEIYSKRKMQRTSSWQLQNNSRVHLRLAAAGRRTMDSHLFSIFKKYVACRRNYASASEDWILPRQDSQQATPAAVGAEAWQDNKIGVGHWTDLLQGWGQRAPTSWSQETYPSYTVTSDASCCEVGAYFNCGTGDFALVMTSTQGSRGRSRF